MSASGDSDHLSQMMEESDIMEEQGSEEGEDMDLHDILETFFLESKKNRNVVDVLLEIKRSLEMHNKIMVKILGHLQASSSS